MDDVLSDLRVEGDSHPFRTELTGRWIAEGLREVTLRVSAAEPSTLPAGLALRWGVPLVDIAGRWTPVVASNRGLIPDWSGAQNRSMATLGAPVVCHYSADGRNRITFAASDAMNVLQLRAGVNEETATLQCAILPFGEPGPMAMSYELRVLIDTRDLPYYQTLEGVQQWWARQPGYQPSGVPEAARRPMYSTWYSFHQHLDMARVVRQCEIARELGCEGVIVDDGWQTRDGSRGYAYCGDWEPERIPDMRGFVDAVHQAGMKFLLWYAVPFVGKHAAAFRRFEKQLLRYDDQMNAGVLDPRFPEVRTYLIDLYERHMRQWGLDGFKLDFVDQFTPERAPTCVAGDGRDIASVPAAADRLLSDVMARLRAVNPQVMIEFRQSYIGPLMRKYGNIFRAADCPNDLVANRMRTLDIRLLGGATATHGDMLMWHPGETAESAALQVLACLFAVPQISILLDTYPPTHVAMLRFWLGFWNANREVLLDGALEPFSPGALYPLVRAVKGGRQVIAVYDQMVCSVHGAVEQLYLANATRYGRLVVEWERPQPGVYEIITSDCLGNTVHRMTARDVKGVQSLAVPPAGLISVRCQA